jgi:hypothetical protein
VIALPAVATISTVAATATISTIAAAASTTTAAALFLRASLVDHEIASAKVLAVKGIDRAISFFIVGNFDESETT